LVDTFDFYIAALWILLHSHHRDIDTIRCCNCDQWYESANQWGCFLKN